VSKLTGLLRESYNPHAFDGFSPTDSFVWGTAGALIWMSQLAYETDDPGKIRSVLADWGMRLAGDDVISGKPAAALPMASTEAIVASGRGATILAFAGTEPLSLPQWLRNLRFRAGAASTAKGFQEAFDAVEKKILPLISARAAADGAVFVTGHSLGGALAVIAAHVLQSNRIEVAGVYTYGMPRPGDKAFADGIYDPALGPRTYRLVHGADVVATVAPSELGSRHVGRLLRCRSGTRFDPATLSQVPGPDDPHFVANTVQRVADVLSNPRSAIASFAERATLVTRIIIGQTPAHGRPAWVAALVETLPPEIRDHLPDSYINALDAGPL